jgi:hypothetical protein
MHHPDPPRPRGPFRVLVKAELVSKTTPPPRASDDSYARHRPWPHR